MSSQVVLITFDESAKAYQAFSKLKQLDGNEITIHSAGVISRDDKGNLNVEDGGMGESGGGLLTGGLVGSLVGILGGPLGVLLGWAGGALIGGAVDADKDDDSLSAVNAVARAIPLNTTAVVAHVDETSPAALDQLAAAEGGRLERADAESVVSDLNAASKVKSTDADQARDEAKQAKQDQSPDEVKATLDEQTKSQ